MPTIEQKITVLKHLANGRDTDWVSTVTKLPQDVVEELADDAGWPDPERLVSAIEALTKSTSAIPERVDHSVRPTIAPGSAPTSTTAPRPDLSVARHTPAPTPPVVNTKPRIGTSTAELLHLASESSKAGTRNLGKRISGLLADLTQRIHDETEEREAREAAAAEKAKNARRIAELEAELARLKGKPAPRQSDTSDGTKRSYTLTKGEFPCDHDGCDRVLDTAQGKAAHQRRAHEGFDPRTSRATDAA